MKVRKQSFVRFLELLALKGEVENKEVLLNIESDKINTKLIFARTVAIKGELKGEFESIGQIGIDNIQLLLSVLKLIKTNEVNITKEDNKLVFTGDNNKLVISIILREPEYIVNSIEDSKLSDWLEKTKGNEFTLPYPVIESIVKYVNAIGADNLLLNGKDKELSLSVTNNENNILSTFDIEQTISPFKVRLGKFLLSILNSVDREIQVSMKSESPVSLSILTEDYNIIYIVAPISEE